MLQPFLIAESVWIQVKDANPTALEIFHRHYSYRPYKDGRKPLHFVGPGEKMVLLTPEADALFVWRKFISRDGQQGVNCAVFRCEREGKNVASGLIKEAMALALGTLARPAPLYVCEPPHGPAAPTPAIASRLQVGAYADLQRPAVY